MEHSEIDPMCISAVLGFTCCLALYVEVAFINTERNLMLFLLSRLWPLCSLPPHYVSVVNCLTNILFHASPLLACNIFKDSKEMGRLKRQQVGNTADGSVARETCSE